RHDVGPVFRCRGPVRARPGRERASLEDRRGPAAVVAASSPRAGSRAAAPPKREAGSAGLREDAEGGIARVTDNAVVLERLRKIIVEVIGTARVPPDVGPEVALGDGGLWLDSVEVLQVVLASESEFGITFEPGEDLVGDGVATLGALADVIRRRSQ